MATTHEPTESSPPVWILLDTQPYIENNSSGYSESTAGHSRNNGKSMEVSLWPDHPPAPSRLSLRCPGLRPDEAFASPPRVLHTAGCFVLLLLHPGLVTQQRRTDYLIYRPAGPCGPSLHMLPGPHCGHFFPDCKVGLLPRGDHFTVAALCPTAHDGRYILQLFKSEDWSWSSMPIPDVVPHHLLMDRVITLGGEGGTMAWVDMTRGILLCDLLRRDNPRLRHVPLPAKLATQVQCEHYYPISYRDIAVVGDSTLKVVKMEVFFHNLANVFNPRAKIYEWVITTYTNSKLTDAPEDWEIDCTVRASDIRISDAMRAEFMRCEMLTTERGLQNLFVCQPALGLNDDEGVVYLIARVRYDDEDSKAWILAVDMRSSIVQAMTAIETGRRNPMSLTYRCSTISSYLNATTPVTSVNKL